MSYDTRLSIESNTYSVRRYCLIINRESDVKGRPSSDPTWMLYLLLDGVKDSTLTNWMIDPSKLIDGSLILRKHIDGAEFKRIEFTQSSCSFLNDHFSLNNTFVTSYVKITGKNIKINNAELLQKWPGH